MIGASPNRVGRFRVRRQIARGGMGVVVLAEDPDDHGRLVAVKLIHPHLLDDASMKARFLREGRIAAGLRHPNIVAVLEVGESDRSPYLVMEYVDGGTLADEFALRGHGSVDRLLTIAHQCCAALAYAHAAGVVHRDVNPRNLLLTAAGDLKVGDFGIAHARDEIRLTVTGSVLGTARYLAPEQAAGQVATAASDLYALGVVLYELLAARAPYEAESLAALVLLQQTRPPEPLADLRPDVPAPIVAAIMDCLARDPGGRPASAAALAWRLGLGQIETTRVSERTAGVTEPLALPTTVRSTPPRPRAGRRAQLLAGACVLATVGLVLFATAGGSEGGAGGPPPATAPATQPVVRPAPTDPSAAVQAHGLAQWLRTVSG